MSLYVSIIGIDGSGKSTVLSALADLAAAELGMTAAAVGDGFWAKTPEEDRFRPGFFPDGKAPVAHLNQLLHKGAKAATDHRRLYPPLKLAHLATQERVARWIEARYQPDVILCDGNLLLSAAGRAINYVDPKAEPDALTLSIDVLYEHVMDGKPLPSPPAPRQAIPCLGLMRWLRRLDGWLHLNMLQLPDVLVFLDVAPETALARLTARGRKLDGHENLHDLAQAQAMYRRVVAFFRHRRDASHAAVIDATALSVGETLQQVLDLLRRLPTGRGRAGIYPQGKQRGRLGTTDQELSKTSTVFKKVLTYRYLIRYALLNLHRGSAHELTFPMSRLGQLFLREGYSAEVMRAIYLQESHRYGLLDRIFLGYPLHRAVYHRLGILRRAIERELWHRLARLPAGEAIKVMTAPSGYAFDLFQPLERIARSRREWLQPFYILASDLDLDGRIEAELARSARKVGLGLLAATEPAQANATRSPQSPDPDPERSERVPRKGEGKGKGSANGASRSTTGLAFVRGDLTSAEMRERFRRSGPYDVVLFVGLSCWISKPHLVRHMKLIRQHLLAPGGVLVTDCFTPHAFALSGKYVGYKANYYSPKAFTNILAYCGFDPADMAWQSGPEGINHVCVARVRPIGIPPSPSPGLGRVVREPALSRSPEPVEGAAKG